jgi:transketolase
VPKLGPLSYKKGEKIATRQAYGNALKNLGTNDIEKCIISLDGDTKNSTFAQTFKNAFPERFIECFIAE